MQKTVKKHLPSVIIIIIYIIWFFFFPFFSNDFLNRYYYMPVLGIIAATVANTTPAAAGIVYFPVLIRLQIHPAAAAQFSLIIQAYGMGLGSLKWYLVNKNLFLKKVIPVCMAGGITGITVSIVFLPIKNPEALTLVFNLIAFMFTQIIFFSILLKHSYPNKTIDMTIQNVLILLALSFTGGLISGWIGFGIDTLFYFLLTFYFRINPAVAIVTSISLMAGISITGTILNFFFREVPLSLWYAAVPGVTVAGLFLASFFAVKLGAKNILLLFTLILSLDFFMTFWTQHTIPISQGVRMFSTYILVGYLAFIHIKMFKQSYHDIGSTLGDFTQGDKNRPDR